jgi:hypothetical protein
VAGSRWSRRLVDGATEHLGYKAVAFLLAVALWVAASGEEPASRYVRVHFVPTLDNGMTLVGDPPPVRALVEGPAREILKLYGTPPAIHHAFGRESTDTMRVDLRPADIELPTGVARVSVLDVQPRTLTVHLRSRRAGAPAGVPNDTFTLTPVGPATVPAPHP